MYNSLLTTFVCAADCGSFNKAAEKLYLSPPSVMKQINALEKHLELQLFERTAHGIRLTAAGQVIYRQARQMFACSEQAIAEAKRAAQTAQTTLRIGSSLLNPCKPFMDLWYQLDREFSGYRLNIVPFRDDHEGILSEIAALGDKFDFLIGVCDSQLWLNYCSFLPLGQYQHCIAVSRGHRLAGKEKITLSDLYGETIMMVKEGDSAAVDAIRAALRQHPQICVEDTPQFYDIEVFNRCEQTTSVMLTIECWKDVHPALVTIPVEWDFPIAYGLLYPLNPSEEIQRVVECVKAYTSSNKK